MPDAKLGSDVFLALAAIGWADGKLDSREADAIVRAAVDEGLDLDEIQAIEDATKEPIAMGEIDVRAMSKADRLFVYAVGSWITRVDGRVADEEREALSKLGIALGIPERARRHTEAIVGEVAARGDSEEAAFYDLARLRATLEESLAEARRVRAQPGRA